jgi:hypothetical protein
MVRRAASGGVGRRALVALGLIALLGALAFSDVPLCPTAFFLGVPCPGCGMTRAALALLHGDVHGAIALHPLAPLFVPLVAVIVGKALVDYVRGSPPAPPERAWWAGRASVWLASALLALLVGLWIARFAGYFGGPVAVESFRARVTRTAPARSP